MNKPMDAKDLEYFKKKLDKEKSLLEEELKTVGRKNSHIAGGWEAKPENLDVDSADDNEVADKMEGLEENSGILDKLEMQLTEVNAALDRVRQGSYGVCMVAGEPIEKERLMANPSAKTCLKHMRE
jgi:RNA polymerase-binding transcription factor DksA